VNRLIKTDRDGQIAHSYISSDAAIPRSSDAAMKNSVAARDGRSVNRDSPSRL